MTVSQIPNWQSQTAEQLHAYLLEVETVPNSQTITTASLLENLGPDSARVVLGSMQAAATSDPIVGAAYQALVTVGITLHQPDRLAMIAALAAAAGWPPELTAAVKALGVTTRPRWQSLGYATEPTLQTIEAELQTQQADDELTFDRFSVLLSINRGIETRVSCRVQRAALDGLRLVTGDTVETFSSNGRTELPPHQAALVAAIQSALDAYEVALNG